jgi:hypothetical protein
MSVIMSIVVEGDPTGIERYATENPDKMREMLDHAVEHGLIAHRFYGSDGKVMVLDEWPDEQSFLDFFGHMQPQIQRMMEAAGITGEPRPVFWGKLESGDDYGWGA